MHRDVQIPGDRVKAFTPHKPLNRRQLAFHRKRDVGPTFF